MKTALHWFRRDLRLSDNTALNAATRQAETVWPVFILDDHILGASDLGANRVTFFLASLRALAQNLAAQGYPLIVRRGHPEREIPQLCRELRAQAVFCNRDYEPYCQQRDQRLFRLLNADGVGFEIFKDAVLWEERDLLTQAGHPFTVFTPYAKAWKARPVPKPLPRLKAISPRAAPVPSLPLPATVEALGFPAATATIPPSGEHAAQQLLRNFLRDKIRSYGEHRNDPARDGTSHLSPHLHFGTINIRTILARLADATVEATASEKKSAEVFLNELIWREFYLQILANFPRVATGCFRPEYDQLAWREDRAHFQAWGAGQTGYPIVDAALRCLNATGWMHNRNRMIVAMFLTKDLLLPWSWGERYFMQTLVDGNLAANNGGWQWSAGTGTDAAPYFRIFNPTSQGEKFDPQGDFVRQWVPELSALTGPAIHRPWEAPAVTAGLNRYPSRIVLHEAQRPKCLALFQAVPKTRPAGGTRR